MATSTAQTLHRNDHQFVDKERFGRPIFPYKPTYDFAGEFISADHGWYDTCPAKSVQIGVRPNPTGDPQFFYDSQYDVRDVFGALRRGDALKLYEIAYFCAGDIVELGTGFGLSSSIMARALEAAQGTGRIDTVDLNAHDQAWAKRAIERLPGHQRMSYHHTDGTSFLNDFIARGRKAHFVFIDHAHSYGPVLEAAKLMDRVVVPGGFVLFHDYNDWRNSSVDDPQYADLWATAPPKRLDEWGAFGIYQAAHEGLSTNFEFYGSFGCTGLFRKMRDEVAPQV